MHGSNTRPVTQLYCQLAASPHHDKAVIGPKAFFLEFISILSNTAIFVTKVGLMHKLVVPMAQKSNCFCLH